MISHCEFAVRYKKSEIHVEVQVLRRLNGALHEPGQAC
jgi:hypothetical protein